MVSLGVWFVTVFLSGYVTSPWHVLEFLKRDPFSFFLGGYHIYKQIFNHTVCFWNHIWPKKF